LNNIDEIISDLEQQRQKIERALAALREITQSFGTTRTREISTTGPRSKRHRLSAAGRRAISEATKKRWALKRVAESAAAPKKPAVKTATRTRKARKKRL
jgi:hypothetical protein